MGKSNLKSSEFDISRIRKCELVVVNNQKMIQFIAIGDRHKLMKLDDGALEIIKLPEQGKDYRYAAPLPVDDGLKILSESSHIGHKTMAQQIRAHMAQNA